MLFIRRKIRSLHRRLIDRIELMRVHGWLAKLVRDPDRMTRWGGALAMPWIIVAVVRSLFYMNSRIENEVAERDKRRELHAARKLHLLPASEDLEQPEGKR
jgi:hypothetical protein